MKAAARSSASPPISPISTMARVCGSASKAARASMCVVPMTGSPPIPMAVEKPRSRSSNINWKVRVPDFDTRPTGPGPVMSAGVIPTLDLPGLMMPGQFGPISRTPRCCAWARKAALSATGMPSVMMTTSGIPASTASMTAALACAGGTNSTETSAPVVAIASATVPKTGTSTVPWPAGKETDVPALRWFTPPTIVVPAASIRAVCFWPSEPVMPWTTTREVSSMKIAMRCAFSRSGEWVEGGCRSGRAACLEGDPGGGVGRTVHRVDERDERVGGSGQDPPALRDVVAVQAHHQRLGRGVAEDLQGVHDAVRHLVAGGDPAEHVDEDAPDLRVAEDDVEPGGHHLRGGTAADVQEVGRPDPTVRLAGVRDDVERAHHQPGAVADDPDLALEPHVVQGVLGLVDPPQLLQDLRDLARNVVGETGGCNDLGRLRRVDAHPRVHRHLGECLRPLDGELLDVHATLDAGHRQVGPVGAVEQDRDVVLLRDPRTRRHHHPVHGVALDVHAEDLRSPLGRLGRVVRQLDAARLAPATGLDLRLHDHGAAAEALGPGPGLVRRGGDVGVQHRHTVPREHVPSLVLVQVHFGPASLAQRTRRRRDDRNRGPKVSSHREIRVAGRLLGFSSSASAPLRHLRPPSPATRVPAPSPGPTVRFVRVGGGSYTCSNARDERDRGGDLPWSPWTTTLPGSVPRPPP